MGRKLIDSNGAARVEAAVNRLSFFSLAPVATAFVQDSERLYENGVSGDGVDDIRKFWTNLRPQTAYTSQGHALPWAFAQNSTCELQEGSLQLHAENKAAAVLLACSKAEMNVSIDLDE